MNLGITVEIILMPIGKTLEHITTEAQIGEEIEEVEARALVRTTHNSTKIEHTRQHLMTTTTKNLTQNFSHPV